MAHKILIVDDEPNIVISLEFLMKKEGFEIAVAGDGEEALLKVASFNPDLVLLDVMMPDMDGYEVLRRLQVDEATRTIPVIFITAMDSSENEEQGLALGAVDYITKPINPAIVLARVQAHLELKFARDRLTNQNEWLEEEIARRMRENLLIQDLSLRTLACIAEARDVNRHPIFSTDRRPKVST